MFASRLPSSKPISRTPGIESARLCVEASKDTKEPTPRRFKAPTKPSLLESKPGLISVSVLVS